MNLAIKKLNLYTVLGAIFILDCAVMPVIKVYGLSFKISYVIAFLFLGLYIFYEGIARKNEVLPLPRKQIILLILMLILFAFSEVCASLLFGITVSQNFLKLAIGMTLMIGSAYFGCKCKANIGIFAYWGLMLNILVNCTLALLGRSAPAILTKIYSISLDTYIDGYYRNGGIMGNPNSSLLIMNIILMVVVILYKFDKVKLSNVQIMTLYLLPLCCDIIVSSRGEFLHTIIILVIFTVYVIKKEKNTVKIFKTIFIVVLLAVLVLALFWGKLTAKFDNIQKSIDRLTTIESVTDTTSEKADTDSILRPLLRFGDFFIRFKVSPIWGTGIESNSTSEAFAKGTTGYHNDIFFVLGSMGILGLVIWILILKDAYKKLGFIIITPFLITAISNTFVRSYFGTMMYFFIICYIMTQVNEEAPPAKFTRIKDPKHRGLL